MSDPTVDDPWEPHWLDPLPGQEPIDRSGLEMAFAGIHPDDQIHHDAPVDLTKPGLGLVPPPPVAKDEKEAAPGAPPEATEGEDGQPSFDFNAPDPSEAAPEIQMAPEYVGPQPAGPLNTPDVTFGKAMDRLKTGPLVEPGSKHYLDFENDPLSNPNAAERDAVMRKMALEDPERFAQIQAQHEQAKQDQYVADMAAAAKENRRRAEEEQAAYEKAVTENRQHMAELGAQVDDLGKRKIDPGRYMRNRSFGTLLLDMLGGYTAGIVAQGGPNQYLQMLQRRIDEDIDAQKADIENGRQALGQKRTVLAEMYEQSGNLHQAAEAARIGAYNAAATDAEIRRQQFDPRGTQSLRLGEAAAGWRQAAAAAAQKYAKDDLDFRTKQADLAIKIRQELRATDAANAKRAAAMGAGLGAAKAEPKFGATYATLNDVPDKDRKNAFRLPSKNGVPGGYVIAGNDKARDKAQELSELYTQLDYDLNEMQRISLERNGAMSAGGSIWSKWKDTKEQSYEAKRTHFANAYGKAIHGQAPTAGTLEEVNKTTPELKGFWEGGDTTDLINSLRNDIDNRASLQFQALGANTTITSDRPRNDAPTAENIVAPLLSDPVRGDAGIQVTDPKAANAQLDQLFQFHAERAPGTTQPIAPGDVGQNLAAAGFVKTIDPNTAQKAYQAELDKVAAKNKKVIADHSAEIAKLTAKAKHTPQDAALLHQLADDIKARTEVLGWVEASRKKSVADVANRKAEEKAKANAAETEQYVRAYRPD